jgi:hypothetical protein
MGVRCTLLPAANGGIFGRRMMHRLACIACILVARWPEAVGPAAATGPPRAIGAEQPPIEAYDPGPNPNHRMSHLACRSS